MNLEKRWGKMLLVGGLLVAMMVGCNRAEPIKDSDSFDLSAIVELERALDALKLQTEGLHSDTLKLTGDLAIEQQRVRAQLNDLSNTVAELSGKLGNSAVTRDEVVKMVSTKFEQEQEARADAEDALCECKCECDAKIAELTKQLSELKDRVVTIEAKPAYTAAAASGGSTGSVKASGGSTGTVKFKDVAQLEAAYDEYLKTHPPSWGGSTGSVKASGGSTGSVKSGGSTGNVQFSQPKAAAAGDPHITVVSTPTCSRCPGVIDQVTSKYSVAGWTVEVESDEVMQRNTSYPYFRVCVGDLCEEVHCDVSRLDTEVKQLLRKWGVSFGETPVSSAGPRATRSQPVRSAVRSGDGTPVRSAVQAVTAPVRAAGNLMQSWGTGRALDAAVASASFRALNRIKGHSQVDLRSGMSNGVGWSSNNPQPSTCFWPQRGQGAYASVQGEDGYYGTLMLY